MYQMTLFTKKVIYKKIFFLGEYAPKRAKSLIKGMASLACVCLCAAYFFDTC